MCLSLNTALKPDLVSEIWNNIECKIMGEKKFGTEIEFGRFPF